MDEQIDNFKYHPIQLFKLAVKELSIRSYIPPESSIAIDPNEKWKPDVSVGYGELDKNNVIQISVIWKLGDDKPESDFPVYIKVEVVGFFKIIDTGKFNPKDIVKFAKINAPVILLPFIRAEIFTLTARAGFKPLLLPLTEVPVFKLTDKE